MNSYQKSAAVIGGGLSGLSAAWTLHKAGWKVCVLEATERVGGRAATIHKDGYLIDTGASALTASYHAYLELAAELDLSKQILLTSQVVEIPRGRERHIFDFSRIARFALRSGLLSWPARLRLARLLWDVGLARLRGQLDFTDMGRSSSLDFESARDYASRALGTELADYFCDPLVRVMLISDSEQISKVELFSAVSNIVSTRLMGLMGGVNLLTQTLACKLDVRFNAPAISACESGDAVEIRWQQGTGAEETLVTDACVVATELPVAGKLCIGHNPVLEQVAGKLQYTSALTVSLGTRTRPKTEAFMVPLPACESPEVAILFMDHNKCPDRAPAGRYLINSHWEASASRDYFDADDEVIVARTIKQILQFYPELEDSVEMTNVTRWRRALPKTSPGAYRMIAKLGASIDRSSPIQYAGDYLSGAGQNTAVEMGRRAAENILGARNQE